MKTKKPSYRALEATVKGHRAYIETQRELASAAHREIHALKQELKKRVDESMIEPRIQLAKSLCQLTESVAKAIQFVVAKETL